tara:strand:+ start:60 stop:1781 length:1722 start_codon:yes stop_codon:yes gene_type:complete
MVKIGQIGNGRFGKKIISKIKNISEVNIEWISNSQDKWWEQKKVDWVIISSPNEYHYEQSKYFLENNTNVFCEKPGTLSSNSLKELIELSQKNNLCFYIDDVLIYENIKHTNKFIYKKWGGLESNPIDRMAYHHFYLIYDDVVNCSLKNIEIIKNNPNNVSFKINYPQENKNYYFEYDFNWYKDKIHNIEPQFEGDALQQMLNLVLKKEVNFELNLKRSLFATKISEEVKSQLYGKCAVIGGGIYGCTAAIKLRNRGFDVDLYEKEKNILMAASGINQYRVHRGYHYPRSLKTIKSCKNNEFSFIKNYQRSILTNNKHYYSIASEESLTTPEEYLSVLDKMKLEWKIVDTLPNCDLTIEVNEKLYDPNILRKICLERLKGNGVNLILNKKAKKLKGYNYTIYSTYSSLNDFTDKKSNYQFELCEKPILKLPEQYQNKSIVIMDGPFMCFDPFGNTGYHLGGNVVHAIHVRNIGDKPEIPQSYKTYLNKGIIKNPKYTNIDRFIESAKKYFPEIEKSEHLGSMYTIRTVLPHKDNTDERPTIVTKHDNNFILFSGKVGNCVEAAEKIINLINED